MPGVIKVVRDGSFLAVIAEREEQAIQALDALRENAVWDGSPDFPPQQAIYDHLLTQPAHSFLVVDGTSTDDPIHLSPYLLMLFKRLRHPISDPTRCTHPWSSAAVAI